MRYIEQCLETEERTYTTYNSVQLAQKLRQERQVDRRADRLSRILKKRATDGNERAPATAISQTLSSGN